MKKFHSIKTFLHTGLKEWQTWVGIIGLLCVLFNQELLQNILSSQKLADTIATVICGLLMAIKFKK
jgi:uncharacterized membrane protein